MSLKTIGELNRRIALLEPIETLDGQGGSSTTFIESAKVWAKIEPLESREMQFAGGDEASISHRITIRYRSGIRSGWRVSYSGRTFEAVGPPRDLLERHQFIEIDCFEREG
jgi:SPP1 family predicted phage head-tail adaptor